MHHELPTFSPKGFWMSDIPNGVAGSRALAGEHRFDAIVVGGGFTGLSAAIALRERNLSVALVERGVVCAGASGFNSGQVGVQLGMNPRSTLRALGVERTRRYADVLQRAIANVGHMVARSGLSCDYRPIGNLTTGVHETQRPVVEAYFTACDKVGLPVKMLDTVDLARMGIPAFVKNAYHELIGGDIHPAKYAYALASVASSLGVAFFENSPITAVHCAPNVKVEGAKGRLIAPLCVVATNAYSGEIGLMKQFIIPYSVSGMVTERLSEDQRRRIGWPNGEPLHTPHKMIENIRLTPDGRLLIGTKRARLGFGTHHPRADHPMPFRALVTVLRERFPELGDLSPDMGWTGRIAVSSDFMPFFDYLNGHKNVVFGGGYGGHGVAMASYAGGTLARMLLGENTDDVDLFVNRRRRRVPPEPLRWLAGNALGAAMIAADNAIDRRARAELS